MAENSAFISYRRDTGYPWARLVWDELRQRSVNAFLDVESLREAGRFDERILKQIAARPYFLAVIADGSLDRCAAESDWVRREIEHAIDNDRIIVPLFIAPFEPSRFPASLPPRIGEALANSSGVTFYSEFVPAALDQLIGLIKPVALRRVGLTDDDARFERRAQQRVESEQRPELPPTQTIAVQPAAFDAEVRTGTEVDGENLPTSEATPEADAQVVESESEEVPWYADVQPPAPKPPDTHSELADSGREPRPVMSAVEQEGGNPPNWKMIAIASAAAIALVVGIIVGLSIFGGDDGDGGAEPVESNSEGSADVEDSSGEAATVGSSSAESTVQDITRLTNDGDNAYVRNGEPLVSVNGRHRLVMTAGGQLVLRTDGAEVWKAEYVSTAVPGAVAILQEDDGNFVVYSSETPLGEVLWTIGVLPGENVVLEVREEDQEGFLALYGRTGDEVWRRPESRTNPNRTVNDSTAPETAPATTTAPSTTTSPTTVPSSAEITVG